MKHALGEFIPVPELCRAIFEADTAEEVAVIKQEFFDSLRANGVEEELISKYDYYLNTVVEKFENGELTFDENGELVRVGDSMQEGTLVPVEEENAEPFSAIGTAAALTVVASVLVFSVYVKKTLRQKVFKKRK